MAVPDRYWLQLGRNATSEMFIFWQGAAGSSSTIEYRIEGAGSWTSFEGTNALHPFTGDGFPTAERRIHKCALTGLSAGSTYEFKFPGDSTVFRFWTLPSTLASDVRAVFAHDFGGNGADRVQMSARFANSDPYFMALAGDWAYADALAANIGIWDTLWDIWVQEFTVTDNRIIPVVPGIGNHEVIGGYSSDPADAPYYYAFFDTPYSTGAYQDITAGSWLTLAVLDSEHTSGNYTGSTAQETWLSGVLSGSSATHKVAMMHVPFYPGSRDPNSSAATRGKTYIAPLFEDNGVRTVFTAHDHVYHRTLRIMDGAAVADTATGVRYFGEGGWGAAPRSLTNSSEFYVDEVIGTNDDVDKLRHGHLVTFQSDALVIESIGRVERFHGYIDPPAEPAAPTNAVGVKALAAAEIVLSWDDVLGASGFKVYQGGSLYSTVYTNEIVVPRGYGYSVSAFNDEGESVKTTCQIERCA